MASIWINDNIGTPSTINLFSDSQASLKALSSTVIRSRLVQDIVDQPNTLGTASHRVELRDGSSSIPIGPEPFLPQAEGIITNAIEEVIVNSKINLIIKFVEQSKILNREDLFG